MCLSCVTVLFVACASVCRQSTTLGIPLGRLPTIFRRHTAACFPVSPLPLTTRRRVLQADTAWSTVTALLLQRGVVHHTQPLACRHPPSPLHPSAIYWLPQFPTRLAMAAGGAMCLFQLCFRSYFQVFHLYVAYVAMATYVCCKYMFQTFQLFETYVSRVSSVCLMCFI